MRNIKHQSIRENDVLRVSGNIGDMQIARTGVVAHITPHMYGVDYTTKQGIVLLSVDRDGNTGIVKLKIQLLNHQPDTPLFDLTDSPTID